MFWSQQVVYQCYNDNLKTVQPSMYGYSFFVVFYRNAFTLSLTLIYFIMKKYNSWHIAELPLKKTKLHNPIPWGMTSTRLTASKMIAPPVDLSLWM